jgi:FkbM family methyltransferase
MVHYASLYPGARIVGVELDAENARLASINTAAVPNAAVINAAIWRHDGTVAYAGDHAWGYQVAADGGRAVTAISMPSLIARYGLTTIDFLKVDIEGGERQLLTGDLAWLSCVRALAVEVHNDEPLIETLIAALRARGFEAARDTHHSSAVIAARPNWSERQAS